MKETQNDGNEFYVTFLGIAILRKIMDDGLLLVQSKNIFSN